MSSDSSIPLSRPRTASRRAFSLVELLSVMGIMSLLAAAAVPALRGPMDGYNVSGAANSMEGVLALSRQTAMTRNVPVEVRFYKHKDEIGEGWRMVAPVITAAASGKAVDEYLMEVRPLTGNIVMEATESFSTIISNAGTLPPSGPKIAPWQGKEADSAPNSVRGKDYVAFQYNPDGSTNLPSDEPWCVTLRNWHSRPENGRPADNFVSLVVDSHTGRTLKYQP